MQNKNSLLHLIDRAERGSLLPGEAQILRDAVELLDDFVMLYEKLLAGGSATPPTYQGSYEPSTTQTFRVIDDVAPGRP